MAIVTGTALVSNKIIRVKKRSRSKPTPVIGTKLDALA